MFSGMANGNEKRANEIEWDWWRKEVTKRDGKKRAEILLRESANDGGCTILVGGCKTCEEAGDGRVENKEEKQKEEKEEEEEERS
ncbi:hypothetical protein M0802_004703 [Mischocyttarus mexicanus]|nr:hypothetical protein M0802_004703 [Mischocyttarus mexicanus]